MDSSNLISSSDDVVSNTISGDEDSDRDSTTPTMNTNEDDTEEDESGWETCDDSDSDSEEEEVTEADAVVYEVRCLQCQSILSSRAMKVLLVAVADTALSLFSTDIPADSVTTTTTTTAGDTLSSTPHSIYTCACSAEKSFCRECGSAVGYHVLQPCTVCNEYEHNSHFWLFLSEAVTPRTLGDITWSQGSYNGNPNPEPDSIAIEETGYEDNNNNNSSGRESGDDDNADDDADETVSVCCICAASPMYKPTRVLSCGHSFCFGCISREVDARGRCPLDRGVVSRDMLSSLQEQGRQSS